ncbi:hypothetical protein NDU88_011484 [Pleurodeles waltl]|uniref:Uncharacterized protein n=1 Tax=Pleurodeles waltl TaxID=8319 RepID=A0AAV7QYQ6_PLEWA|nr:hypothetical protein NDU88_011484 [Pleurodeles waltl]
MLCASVGTWQTRPQSGEAAHKRHHGRSWGRGEGSGGAWSEAVLTIQGREVARDRYISYGGPGSRRRSRPRRRDFNSSAGSSDSSQQQPREDETSGSRARGRPGCRLPMPRMHRTWSPSKSQADTG